MENVEVENMEIDWDQLDCPNARGGSGQLLLLPVVALREILKNLSSADCLNLSLVNKLWHREALSVLRGRGCLTGKMYKGYDDSCKDLRAFASDLRRMREVREVVPFSGLTVAVSGKDRDHGDWCQESAPGEFVQIYEDIVLQMEWKHLVLNLTQDWDKKEDCAGFQLVKKILHKRSSVLEEISLEIQSNHEAFNQHFLGDCNFSSLKTLTFWGHQERSVARDEDLIKELISRAPNLKVLCTKSRVNLTKNLLDGRSDAVHMYEFTIRFPSQFDIQESIVSQLRLRSMALRVTREDFNYVRFNWIVPKLLQQSRTTLSRMTADAVLLVLLMHYGICLENVVELSVNFYLFDTSEPRSRELLKSCDFARIFPNLRSVSIFWSKFNPLERTWNAVIDMFDQGNAALNEPISRTRNIKALDLYWFDEEIPDSFGPFLVEMFPDIQKLFISSKSFVRCWDYWLNLEELELNLIPYMSENLDSAFCGIFPQEVTQLQEQDEEYLEKVNVVSVMPSLSCLKSLKTLKVFFEDEFNGVPPPSISSKIAGLIAFKRHTDLTVTLVTNSDIWRQELVQMEPYASVLRISYPWLENTTLRACATTPQQRSPFLLFVLFIFLLGMLTASITFFDL